MDLFEYMRTETSKKESPLAARLRPRTLEEVVGQEHILGEGKLLSRAIKADKLGSVIFYGPPGTGKTTLAQVIAHTTSSEFTQLNATVAGKKDMEEVIAKAQTILEGDERIEEALKGNNPEAAAELLKGELEKANEVKAQLEDDIVKREEEIKKKPVSKKKFQHMFGGFWNGVTSGWED